LRTFHTSSEGVFCEVRPNAVLGSCASPCNPLILELVVQRAVGLVSPTLSIGGAMSELTRERSLDELARGLASGNLSRRKVLDATAGYRELYERLQQNAEENGAE
jgi:hypothetical protein